MNRDIRKEIRKETSTYEKRRTRPDETLQNPLLTNNCFFVCVCVCVCCVGVRVYVCMYE